MSEDEWMNGDLLDLITNLKSNYIRNFAGSEICDSDMLIRQAIGTSHF